MTTSGTKDKAKTTRKPSRTASKAPVGMVAKPAAKAITKSVPSPKLISVSNPVVSEPDLRKKELIDLVVTRSGIKKKDAKPVVEAMLAVLGETIAGGRELNLQPLGKLRINRMADKVNGRVIICKLRQSLANPPTAKEGLAEVPDKL